MALGRDFRETVQARARCDAAFRNGLLSEAIESLLCGEVSLGKELLRDYINATVGFPDLAVKTSIHAKTLHQMFGPNGNPTAGKLFQIFAYLQHAGGVQFEVRPKMLHGKMRLKGRKPRPVKSKQANADGPLDSPERTESRKGILAYHGSGIWEGSLKRMRRNRY